MKGIKLFTLLGITAVLGGTLASCGTNDDGGETPAQKVKIGLHANFGAGAGYSAIAQGYFEQEGIEPEKTIGTGPNLAASLVSGDLNISFMGNGVAWNYFTENPAIKIVALDNLTDDDRLIATKTGRGKDLTVESSHADLVAALKTSTVALQLDATPGSFWTSLVTTLNKDLKDGEKIWYTTGDGKKLPEGLAESNYIDANKVNCVSVANSNITATMNGGKYDFCITFAPVASVLEKQTNKYTVVARTSTHMADGYTPSTWAVNAKWLESNKELFQKTMNALVKGMNYRSSNPAGTAQDIEKISAKQILASSLETDIAVWLNAKQQLELLGNGKAMSYVENIRNSQLNGGNKDKVSASVTAEKATDFTYLKKACEANK